MTVPRGTPTERSDAVNVRPKSDVRYPYPLPEMNPTWRTSTVLGMASAILEAAEGGWDRLPILADALEEAGCDDKEILAHCRCESVPGRCSCTKTYGYPDPTCRACYGKGFLGSWYDKPAHERGKYPNRNGGCWQGTCWVINLILEKPQEVVAVWHNTYRNSAANPNAPTPVSEGHVINPGEADGKTWVVWGNGTIEPPLFVVESEYASSVEDIFIDSVFGEHYRLTPEEVKEYLDLNEVDAEGRITGFLRDPGRYTDGNNPYDSETVGFSGVDVGRGANGLMPFPVMYFGPGIPLEGVLPPLYADRGECVECGKECFPFTLGGRYCSPACAAADGVAPEDAQPVPVPLLGPEGIE